MNNRIKATLAAIAVLVTLAGVVTWAATTYVDDSFVPDLAPVGYVGMPAVSSHLLYTGNTGTTVNASSTRLFAIDYDSSEWSGNLHSYPLTSAGAVVKVDDWVGGAAAKLDVQNGTTTSAVPTGRYIFTRNDVTAAGTIFRWSGLSPAQRFQIQPNAPSGDLTNSTKSSKNLNWVRGNRSDEGTDAAHLRTRGSVLGDIIHSTPMFCPGNPPAGAASCGADTVFVGANDGMLHAIDAATGSERWGYIPSALIAKLPDLTLQGYSGEAFVDGRMDIQRVGSTTILAGTLGGGGKALFALDVTNSAATTETDAASKLLWEITNTTTAGCSGAPQCFANLGYTYGQPLIASLSSTTKALIVNNGYGATSGHASLFIINVSTGALIYEVVMPDGGTTTQVNGLSSPTVISDTAGYAAYAYAGDLQGNLWKIQLVAPYAVTKLHATNPAQSITMAPGVIEHPTAGYIVCFVTGRMLLPDDELANGLQSTSTFYAYGIWDTPGSNTTLLAQTLTERTFGSGTTQIRVRTATNNLADWTTHKGWRTPLPMLSERVIGDGAYVTGNVFLFMSYNPSVTATPPTPDGENWWMQLNALTGGDNDGAVRFDLDGSGVFDLGDQCPSAGSPGASRCSPAVTVAESVTALSPVGRHMGGGRRSQLTALSAGTVNIYQANYDKNITSDIQVAGDPGVAGGHFDYDIYYYQAGTSTTANVPYGGEQTNYRNSLPSPIPICAKTTNVNNEFNEPSPTWCTTANGYGSGYTFMTSHTIGAVCGTKKAGTNLQTIGCSQYSANTVGGSYSNFKHTHQYDDKYDVTGVNMLNASDASFNLVNAMPSTSTPFKILVMNQFLNPAATLTVGPGSQLTNSTPIKSYNNLASQTDPVALLAGLPIYTRGVTNSTTSSGATAYPITNFIFNLPINAFASKDWWGTGGDGVVRAGLIATQTGCVHSVQSDGTFLHPGINGERANGALTFQLIKDTTPSTALELNHNGGNVRYGWRVKASLVTTYVLAEYTTFWHHQSGKCYDAAGWIPNPDQDTGNGNSSIANRAAGSQDPVGGVNGLGGTGGGGTTGTGQGSATIVSQTTDAKTGNVTTTYSDGTVTVDYPDGSTKITLQDGTVLYRLPGIDTGGSVDKAGAIGKPLPSPAEVLGRINWREVRR